MKRLQHQDDGDTPAILGYIAIAIMAILAYSGDWIGALLR